MASRPLWKYSATLLCLSQQFSSPLKKWEKHQCAVPLTSKYLTIEFDVRTNCLLKSKESVKYLIEKQWNSSS